LRIIFAGTPEFAASALKELLAKKYEVVAVLTQLDRPAGRGMQLSPSPVKKLAVQQQIPVLQPLSLKNEEIQQQLSSFKADVMIVAAYGLILPNTVLKMPRLGCLNIHASLLPRWRGAAPIQRALLAGDTETGITIMQMDEGLDTGAMLLKLSCTIDHSDTSQTLHDKLAELGAQAIITALDKLQVGALKGIEQDSNQATYASKIIKAEAQLTWTQSASQLERAVRAYNPFPGAYSTINGTIIKIWQASISKHGQDEPGTVLEINKNHITVACGQDALSLEILQRPNAKPLPSAQFVQGFKIKAGDRFTVI